MATTEATITPHVTTKQSTTTTKDEAAHSTVRNHALLAAGAGIIPIPGVDAAAVAGVQVNMIRKLSEIYHVPFDPADAQTIISAVVTTGLSRLVAYAVNSYTTLFSEFGSFSDNLTNGLVSGAATFGTGEVIQTHFKHGGTMNDLDYNHFITYYQEKIQSGDIVPNDIMHIENGIRSAMQAVNKRK